MADLAREANSRDIPKGVKNPWQSYVEPEPRFAAPYVSYSSLGRDFGGSPLASEQRQWLDEAGITDHGQREFFFRCWAAMDAERELISEERREAEDRR